MSLIERLKSWYRWGHWLNTPQGLCVLLSLPVCWLAAPAAIFLPPTVRPMPLSSEPIHYFVTPILCFIYFIWFGQSQSKPYSSSMLTTAVVVAIAALPFVRPYLHGAGG